MIDSTVECVAGYSASGVEIPPTEAKRHKLVSFLKAIPWTRVVVDTLLVAAILLVASSFLSVR